MDAVGRVLGAVVSGARLVREFATIGPMVDEVSADRVLRSRHCAVDLSWPELVYIVTAWAHERGCEVERLTEETSDSGARVLRVFPPDADERGGTLEWVEPREVCAGCECLASLVELPSGHVETTGCACVSAREYDEQEPRRVMADEVARLAGEYRRGELTAVELIHWVRQAVAK